MRRRISPIPTRNMRSESCCSTAPAASKDPKQALRWLNLAANKGQARAQALLGSVMFKGEVVPRQAARGLMWLTLALDGAGGEKWAVDMHAAASKQATDAERQMAVLYLERYMKGRRD